MQFYLDVADKHRYIKTQFLMVVQAEKISGRGYPVEVHTVETKDGYILQLHRIPSGKNGNSSAAATSKRPVVLLQHGLLDSAECWTINSETESAGRRKQKSEFQAK